MELYIHSCNMQLYLYLLLAKGNALNCDFSVNFLASLLWISIEDSTAAIDEYRIFVV
jgi:hypothetical protein